MNISLLLLIAIVGLSTWAFRFAPTKLDLSRLKPGGLFNSFLEGMGPAAIATLFVAAAVPMIGGARSDQWAIALGLASVVALFYWRHNVIIATLGGSAIYALLLVVIG